MDKVITILKNVWSFAKEKKIYFIVIGVIVGVSSGWFKVMIMKTAYEHQEKQSEKREVSFKKQINDLKLTLSAAEKTVYKYKVIAGKECDCEPKLIEKIVYKDLKETSTDSTKTETNTDTKTEEKSKVKLPNAYKMWQLGGGYDIFDGSWYVRGAIETGNVLFLEAQYPLIFDGKNHLRIGAGIRF